jgi:hypothetical protein
MHFASSARISLHELGMNVQGFPRSLMKVSEFVRKNPAEPYLIKICVAMPSNAAIFTSACRCIVKRMIGMHRAE